MTTVSLYSPRAFEADSGNTMPVQVKADTDKSGLAHENATESNQKDPAYVVEISDTVRAMRQANHVEAKSGESSGSEASSLFTKAGRSETSERYDRVFDELRATYNEEEASKLFDEFMREEGFESTDIMGIGFSAPLTKKMASCDRNLYSHSYMNAIVVDGKEHILAATYATYSNGDRTYHKQMSDSYDNAADATAVFKGRSIYGMLLDEEGYESQHIDFMGRISTLMEDAATNGNFIESTCTEEELKAAQEAAKNRYLYGPPTTKITYVGRAPKMDASTERSSTGYAYMDEKGALRMSSLEEIKARIKNTGTASNSTRQTETSRTFHDFINRLKS